MHENNQLRSNKCKILLFSRNQFTYAADYTKCQPNNVNISSIYFNALKVKNHNRKKIDKQLCLFLVFSYNAFYRTGVRRNFFFFVHFSFYHFTQVSLVVFFLLCRLFVDALTLFSNRDSSASSTSDVEFDVVVLPLTMISSSFKNGIFAFIKFY